MAKITVTLPDSLHLRNVDGERIVLDVTKLSADVIAAQWEAGTKVVATNTFNSGGKDRSDAERRAQLEKKLDAWYAGTFNVVERSSNLETVMLACLVDAQAEANSTTQAKVQTAFRAVVQDVLGDKTKLTWTNFTTAKAKQMRKAGDKRSEADIVAAFESTYEPLAQARIEAEAKAARDTAGIDLSVIDI